MWGKIAEANILRIGSSFFQNDGGWIFSEMAQTRERRQMFIQSAVHFINYFGLDGIDLDWEYLGYNTGDQPTDPLDSRAR